MTLILVITICLLVASNIADDDKLIYQVNLFKSRTSQSYAPYSFRNSSFAVDGNVFTCSYASHDPQEYDFSWWKVTLDRSYDITHIRLLQDKNSIKSTFVSYMQVIVSNDKDKRLCMWLRNKYLWFSNGYKDLTCLYTVNGKYITIRKEVGWLIICEVQVFADLKTTNLALKRPITQRGFILADSSFLPVDGDPLTCSVKKVANPKVWPWMRVVLDNVYYVTDVVLTFKKPKTDSWFSEKAMIVYVSDNTRNYEEQLCGGWIEYYYTFLKENSVSLKCLKPTPGRFVTMIIYTIVASNILVICEFEVYSRGFPHVSGIIANTSSPAECQPHEYACLEGQQCIHKDWLCDGTQDCPLADDESLACKGDENQFKCKRINQTINIGNRCDGVYNCPDNSDEEHCFELYTTMLTVTFKGEPNFYICSDNWHVGYSADICQLHDRDYTATNFFSFHEAKKFLQINKHRSLSNTTGFMALFDKSDKCYSKKIVLIECSYKQDWRYLCGKRYLPDPLLEPYMIRSQDSKPTRWPWHVQVFRNESIHTKRIDCGGSLINKDWVLTAAHCLDSIRSVDDIYMKIGSNTHDDITREKYSASHVIKHPFYVEDNIDNFYDIGLIRLKTKAQFSQQIRPICLPDKPMDKEALVSFRHCVATGFGWTRRDGRGRYLIQQAKINFMESGECTVSLDTSLKSQLKYKMKFNNIFCAGKVINGSNTCRGDSGGPWMCKAKNGIWTQVGITLDYYSIKDQKCTHSLFIAVDHYLDFIHTAMRQNYISMFGRIFITHCEVIPYLMMDVMLKYV